MPTDGSTSPPPAALQPGSGSLADGTLSEEAGFLGAADVRLDLPLATLGSRLAAQWLDFAILAVGIAAIGAATTGAMVGAALSDEALLPWIAAAGVVSFFLLQWGYFFGFELAWRGQTPGKRVLGLRVVTDEGGPPGAVACFVRNLVRILDLLPGTYGIGAIAVYLSRSGKRLGDLAAGTVVIREEPVGGPAPRAWPSGLTAGDVALLERWQLRAPTLLPVAREQVATALVAHLRRRRPGLLPVEGEAQVLLAALTDDRRG